MLFKSLVGSLLAVTAIAAPMAKTVPTTFLLRADGGNNIEMSPADIVSYANSSVFMGSVKYEIYSEPLILELAGSSAVFQSEHAQPNFDQSLYVFPDSFSPVGFVGSTGTVPAGAVTQGFTVQQDFNFRYKTSNKWYQCPITAASQFGPSWQLYYAGGRANVLPGCYSINLNIIGYGFTSTSS